MNVKWEISIPDLLILVNNIINFMKKRMIHKSDISKDFILNKAVHDATNILLRPYRPMESTSNTYESRYEAINHIKDKWISHSQDFLLRMATIAWDFLNILNMFQSNLVNRNIKEDNQNNDV